MAFWKKKKDDFGDLGDFSDLDKMGMDSKEFGQSATESMANPAGQSSPLDTPPPPAQAQQGVGAQPSFGETAQPTQQAPPSDFGAQPSVEQPQSLQQLHRMEPTPLSSMDHKDMELINAKLDSIKAILDNVSQRLARLEQIASGDQKYKW